MISDQGAFSLLPLEGGAPKAFFFEEGGRRLDDVPLCDLLPLEGGGPLAVEVGFLSLLPGSGAETCFVIARSLELGAWS